MRTALELSRDVDIFECPWLDRNLKKGEIVYEYLGHTYGCIDYSSGTSVTFSPYKLPFFELPRDALKVKVEVRVMV